MLAGQRSLWVNVVPDLPPAVPRFGNALTRGLGRGLLRITGWKIVGAVPDIPRLVVIAAPHTCALDVPLGVAIMLAMGVKVRWFAKHTTFRGPLGPPLRWLGGIAVNRATPAGVVRQVIEIMRREDRFFLALAPEGTRRKVEQWKTGFYRIALATGVPIVPVALDYSRKVADIGEPLMPTGDYDRDVARLKQHFGAHMARHPERY